MFTLEGYDESYEFRIFGEEYLKFRHFLIQNNFTFLKFVVKEGWVNAEGKRSDPKIQFLQVQYLQDVLASFAKKLVLQFNIAELSENLIQSLFDLFQKEKGDHQVTIEVLELEKVMKQVVSEATVETIETEDDEENIEVEVEPMVTEVEQVQVVTKLSMPSRKMKIKISNELLQELENRQVSFKLN